MIISHKYKYVFLCLPRTGTTAVRKELCENYEGEEILYKHAPYNVFLNQANDEEKKYKVLVTLRNPMDRIVSLYYKYKSNHDGINKKQIKDFGTKNYFQIQLIKLSNQILGNRSSYVTKYDPSFSEFFMKFYSMPYSDWHSLYFDHYDYIMRFENLQNDFEKAISFLGMNLKRPLPVVNKTKKDTQTFDELYTKDVVNQAQKVFYHSMNKYGYSFPEEWPEFTPTKLDDIQYRFIHNVRKFYWENIR